MRLSLAVRAGLVLLVVTAAPVWAQGVPQTVLYPGLDGADLLAAIRRDYTPDRTLGYGPARDSLFAREQRLTGRLTCVYTGFSVVLAPGADPSTDAFNRGINTEHTFPQSRGAEAEPARSDMHHLFPAKDNVNSSRSNDPYAEVPDAETDGWYRFAQSQSNRPDEATIGEWSEKDNDAPPYGGAFEPREVHKGNAARAVFYFAAIYPQAEPAFVNVQRQTLVRWAALDPVDGAEAARGAWIATRQGTDNPFVLDSTLARRAFGVPFAGGGTPGGGDPPGPSPLADVLWVNELHYDNASADTGEGVEVAGVAGTDLTGWTLTFYNGNGGAAYATVTLSGEVPDAGAGFGAVWTAVPGIQNGPPDGLALADPDGALAQFLSYEGTMTAADGPAAGRTSLDIGVAETGTTPAGASLRLVGTGSKYGDFVWSAPSASSPGGVNAGQAFEMATAGSVAPEAPAGLSALVTPNPARGPVEVTVALAAPSTVAVDVFDALGRRVAGVDARALGAGTHRLGLGTAGLAPGVYAVLVRAGAESVTRLVTVVR